MNALFDSPQQQKAGEMLDSNEFPVEKIAEIFGWQVFETPHRLSDGAWAGHIPFAFWLISALQPKKFVELGVHTGNSYSAFCQAVETHRAPTACFGIDCWEGDEHSGFYPEVLFKELKTYHDAKYSSFSRLMKMRFEEGLEYFLDGSVDLLHIDGLHTYEAVKNDFETWQPKLSDQSVVLFHDTNVRERGFGVYKFWDEISDKFPSFNFDHSNGLGVIGVGENVHPRMKEFFTLTQNESAAVAVRRYLSRPGELLFNSWSADKINSKLEAESRSRKNILDGRTHANNLLKKEKDAHQVTIEKNNTSQQILKAQIDNATSNSQKSDLEINKLTQEIERSAAVILKLEKELERSAAVTSKLEKELKRSAVVASKLEQEAIERNQKIAVQEQTVSTQKERSDNEKKRFERRIHELEKALEEKLKENTLLTERTEALEKSTSWKVTGPLRKIAGVFEK